jgi:hypothetical protein
VGGFRWGFAADVEVIPVASVEETIQSMVAGGLVKPPWTVASST